MNSMVFFFFFSINLLLPIKKRKRTQLNSKNISAPSFLIAFFFFWVLETWIVKTHTLCVVPLTYFCNLVVGPFYIV